MRLTTLLENRASRPGLCAEHGLSVLVENGQDRLLFDTGQTGCLIHNATALGVDLTQIETVVLSHGHYDHAGGLLPLCDYTRPVVYAHPEIFRRRYADRDGNRRYIGIEPRGRYEQRGVTFALRDRPVEVITGVHTTGFESMATSFEQVDKGFVYETDNGYEKDEVPDDLSLVLRTAKGLFIVLGCAHRGMINIIRQAEEQFGERVFGFMGGTHLGPAEKEQVQRTIEALHTMDLEIVAPLHCTGNVTPILEAEFENSFVPLNGGRSITLD